MRTSYIVIALLLCCALALVRVVDVHVHIAHDAEDHTAAAYGVHVDDHDLDVSRIVSELGDHVDAHLVQGEIDAESPDDTTGKLPSLDLLALFVFCAVALLIPASRSIAACSVYDPPPPRHRSYILPLSQAPPLAG